MPWLTEGHDMSIRTGEKAGFRRRISLSDSRTENRPRFLCSHSLLLNPETQPLSGWVGAGEGTGVVMLTIHFKPCHKEVRYIQRFVKEPPVGL